MRHAGNVYALVSTGHSGLQARQVRMLPQELCFGGGCTAATDMLTSP
jgi:hypothetical protein